MSHGGLGLLAKHRKRERLKVLLDIMKTLKTLVCVTQSCVIAYAVCMYTACNRYIYITLLYTFANIAAFSCVLHAVVEIILCGWVERRRKVVT